MKLSDNEKKVTDIVTKGSNGGQMSLEAEMRMSRGYCDEMMSPTLNVTMTMPYSELEV